MKNPLSRRPRATPETAPATPEASPQQTALDTEVERACQTMGEALANQLLPEGTRVVALRKELFQSDEFRATGRDTMPGRYGSADRSLIALTLEGGAQIFVVGGKVSSGNPYEIGHAVIGWSDLRESQVAVYAYDGAATITEYTGEGVNVFTGEYGTPEAFLPYARQSLGFFVRAEEF